MASDVPDLTIRLYGSGPNSQVNPFNALMETVFTSRVEVPKSYRVVVAPWKHSSLVTSKHTKSVELILSHGNLSAQCEIIPNFLFILADDLGWNDIGYNNPIIKTPYLDKLANDGLKLDSAYTLPLCTPSRAAFLTGRYPYTYGMQHFVMLSGNDKPMPLNLTLLPQVMQQLGYETHLVGKWHLGDCNSDGLPLKRGFDTFLGFLTSDIDYYSAFSEYKNERIVYDFWNGSTVYRKDESAYTQDILEAEVIRLIEKSKTQEKPFFILHSTQLPHVPLQVPKQYYNLYPEVEEKRRTYLGMLSKLDDSINNIIESLERNGLRDHTYVIFMSDNGGASNTFPAPVSDGFYGNNYPLRGSKATLYQGGIKVPTFVNSPLLPDNVKGTVTKELFHITDWLPTIASLANGNSDILPPHIDGVDQSDTLLHEAKSTRDNIIVQICDMYYFKPADFCNSSAAIIWNKYKFIYGSAVITEDLDSSLATDDRWYQWNQPDEWKKAGLVKEHITGTNCGTKGSTEKYCLFNIEDDPYETVNIASDHPDIVNKLLNIIQDEVKRSRPPIYRYPYYNLPLQAVTDTNGMLKPGYCDHLPFNNAKYNDEL